MTRPFTRAERNAIKTAFHLACEDIGTLAQVADITRVSITRLSNYGNRDHPDFPPIDIAMDVDAASGGLRIISEMARALGCDVVRGDGHRAAKECPMRQAGNIANETGEVLVAMSDYVKSPTPNNALKAEREIKELREVAELAEINMQRRQVPE